ALILGAVLDLGVGFAPALGTPFKIIDNATSLAVAGPLKDPLGNDLTEGATLTANGQAFTISYAAGDGNDVVVTRNSGPAFRDRSLTPRITEGGVATLSGTITEPDAGDAFFLDVAWGDGTAQTYMVPPSAPRRLSVTHVYAGDPAGDRDVYPVRLVWHDIHGGSNRAQMRGEVRNLPP